MVHAVEQTLIDVTSNTWAFHIVTNQYVCSENVVPWLDKNVWWLIIVKKDLDFSMY